MRHESLQAEAISDMSEIITSREPFFAGNVTFDTHKIFCADKRPVIGVDEYIHLLGGGLNSPYNLAVLQEAVQPGSITEAFESYVESLVRDMKDDGVSIGVHSDHNSEQGERVRTESPRGPVGCVYAEKRPNISLLIADRGEEIISSAATFRPELFQKPEAHEFALSVVAAHGRLAERPGFFSGGRRAVLAAAAAGAQAGVVHGETKAKVKGVINLDPETSMRSQDALEAGVPAYIQDSWAATDILDMVRDRYPHDRLHGHIAELIDTIGSFHALGLEIEDIAVRRPADLSQAA